MGYRCPVCGTEEADGVHLANHLAVTASLDRTDHSAWLEEHAPDWGQRGPEELASIVVEHAEEVETPEFDHGEGAHPNLEGGLARQSRGAGRGSMTTEAEQVLEEARELTRRMHEDEGTDGEENE